jgi:hypothetical protein
MQAGGNMQAEGKMQAQAQELDISENFLRSSRSAIFRACCMATLLALASLCVLFL